MVFDQRDDVLGTLRHSLQGSFTLPDFVKQAGDDELRGGDLPPHAFADSVGRRYPIHTRAATALSVAYFAKTAGELGPAAAAATADKLTAAASYWGVVDDVASMLTPPTKAASACEAYLDADAKAGPIGDEAELQAAAAWVGEHRDAFEPDVRVKYAAAILDRAATLGVELIAHDDLRKMAGLGLCVANELIESLAQRERLLKRADDKLAMRGLAAAVAADPGLFNVDRELAAKVATTLAEFDREVGLDRVYGSRLRRPDEDIYGVTTAAIEKYAEDHIRLQNGSIYDLNDVARMPVAGLADQIGEDVAFSLSAGDLIDREKAAEVLPTLPRDDAARFDRLAAACGIGARTKAAEDRSGLSDEAFAALASI